uniref:Polymerase-associated protein n=1 Tax=Novirhabdovirus hirame TaxID=1980915 RepID=C9WE66_9RHAB|nr:polymerase-associated protein [Novirhabdovirus hirame]
MSDNEGEQFFDIPKNALDRVEARTMCPREDGKVVRKQAPQKEEPRLEAEQKRSPKKQEKPRNMSPLEQLVLKYVEEDSTQDALREFGGLIVQIRQSHQADMTRHLEAVATEHRANLQALTKSQQEHEKVSKEILSAVISIRSNLNENSSPRPKPLDLDQVNAERALGFGVGYRTALNVFGKLRGITPEEAGSQEVKNMAIREAEEDEYEGSGSFFKKVLDMVKKTMR